MISDLPISSDQTKRYAQLAVAGEQIGAALQRNCISVPVTVMTTLALRGTRGVGFGLGLGLSLGLGSKQTPPVHQSERLMQGLAFV